MSSTTIDRGAPGGIPSSTGARPLNAMTIDVEDYFHVSAFDRVVARSDWAHYESRVERNTERLLEIFDDRGILATFFVLGWVAERFPGLVDSIAAAGHEVASHSFHHQLVYDLTPQEFRADLQRARDAIGAACGVRVRGYRAPSFSITRRSLWALDVLIEEGYAYDASIYPVHHDRYGIPDWPRYRHIVQRPCGQIWEVPGATVRLFGVNLPTGGGGYFRQFPGAVTMGAIGAINRHEGQGAVFYLHPWEIDPDQPQLKAPLLSRFRHYRNLSKTEPRLLRLLDRFRFGRIADLLPEEVSTAH